MATRRGTNGKDRLVGTAAADRIFGLNGNDILSGGSGNDQILGGAGNDTLKGDAGDDLLDGGTGIDTMAGGAGNDTFIVDNALDRVSDTAGIDTVLSAVSYVLGLDIEVLTLLGAGNLNGTGNALANTLNGTSGDNVLDGGLGADQMNGGAGNDTFIVDDAGDTVGDLSGVDTVRASVTFTLGSSLENLVLTGSAYINGTGNALANTLTGNDGNNTLNGLGGADTMAGGLGNDTYVVNLSTDIVIEGLGEGTDEVQATGPFYQLALGTEIERLVFAGAGNFTGIGNEFDNVLIGGAGGDTLLGGIGDDTLTGGAGSDGLDGGHGSDTYLFADGDVGTGELIADSGLLGSDRLMLAPTATFVDFSVASAISGIEQLQLIGGQIAQFRAGQFDGGQLSATLAIDGNFDGNTLRIVEAYYFYGAEMFFTNWSSGTIEIVGRSDDNTITGTLVSDTIRGGGGADTLDGGAGDDVYIVQPGDLPAGETISDGGGSTGDTIAAFTGTYDFTTASVSGIEKLFVSAANVTFDMSELAGLTGVSTGGGTNTVTLRNVSSFNGGALSFTNWADGVDTLVLEGTAGADSITGTAFADRIVATAGADTLDGGGGGDTYVFGASGPDAGLVLVASGSNDTIRVERSFSDFTAATIGGLRSFEFSGSGQTIQTLASQMPTILSGDSCHVTGASGTQTFRVTNATNFDGSLWLFDTWSSAEGDLVVLVGTAGNDAIMGTASADRIWGDAGADVLRGRGGNDVFDFGAGSSGTSLGTIDQILDFTSGQDRLRFTDLTGAVETFAGLALTFSPLIAGPEIRYQPVGADTYIMADINGDDVQDMVWQLVGFTGTLTWGVDVITTI